MSDQLTKSDVVEKLKSITAAHFMALDARQQHVIVVAMLVRNALEDFHVANLSDEQMKELNQIVRYALYQGVELIETMDKDRNGQAFFRYLVGMIPDYWEIPGRDRNPNPHSAADWRS